MPSAAAVAVPAAISAAGIGASFYGAEQQRKATGMATRRQIGDTAQANFGSIQKYGQPMADLEQQLRPEFASAGLAGTQRSLFGNANQPGMISQIGQAQSQLNPMLLDQNTNFRPELIRQFRAGDPLLQATMNDALAGIQQGGNLDPATRREVEQAARSGSAARGMGYGGSDLWTELMQIGQESEARKRRNQAFALAALQSPADIGPYSAANTPVNPFGAATSLFGQGAALGNAAGPSLFNLTNQPNVGQQNAGSALAAAGGGLIGLGGQLAGNALANRGQTGSYNVPNNFQAPSNFSGLSPQIQQQYMNTYQKNSYIDSSLYQ